MVFNVRQTLAPARNAECLVRDNDVALQTRARMGEVCPYCHSDEIPLVSSTSAKHSVKVVGAGGKPAAGKPQKPQNQGQQKTEATDVTGYGQTPCTWGEQVVHCDGCDRPCHLRCIFGVHGADRHQDAQQQEQLQPEQATRNKNPQQRDPQNPQKEQEPPQEQWQDGQQQPDGVLKHEQPVHIDTSASIQDPRSPLSPSGGLSDASVGTTKATEPGPKFGVVSGGETVDDVYRWFVEGDCKWFCCVCRLQWERMATAMNFSVDWQARKVLGEGNPLLLPCAGDPGARCMVMSEAQKTHAEQANTRYASYGSSNQDAAAAGGAKRRGCGRGTGLRAHSKRPRKAATESPSPHFHSRSEGVIGAGTQHECHQESSFSPTKGGHDSRLETGGSVAPGRNADLSDHAAGAASGAAAPYFVEGEPPPSDAPKSTGETGESLSSCQEDSKVALPSEKLTRGNSLPESQKPPEYPVEQCDGRSGIVKGDAGAARSLRTVGTSRSLGCKGSSDDAQRNAEPTCSRGSDRDGGVYKKHTNGVVIEEAMRVYSNSSDKRRNSKMQPCPVALTPDECSSEELLGCRTDMLVEPRALLGSLQPCVHCYKLYGAKASVEVCRLTKRHLASNWDHPHFVSPAQIQDALLTCFQDALLTVQREHQQKLQRLFDNMSPLQRGVNMNSLMTGNRQSRIHENAARRSAENMQKPQVHETETVWKGSIPLLSVTLGKTRVDYQFPDGPSKKKWYYGVVSNYQAISSKVGDGDTEGSGEGSKEDEKEKKITYYTNQFRIDYNDGDFQTVPPHELIEMLIETGPGSKLDGRKAITTTPLIKMLSPELKRANRQVNQLVRETNKKGCAADTDSDDE